MISSPIYITSVALLLCSPSSFIYLILFDVDSKSVGIMEDLTNNIHKLNVNFI